MSNLKPLIGVINLSKIVSNDDVKTMVIACQEQLNKDVTPNWHMEPWFIIFYADPKTISPRAYPIVIFDAFNDPNILGFHDEMKGKPYGCIFVEPLLKNNGVILYDPTNPQNISLSSIMSHEIIELYIDKNANLWCDGPKIKEGSVYALEVCDAVQNNSYTKKVYGQLVSVSNFVLPSWFDPQNPPGKQVDFMKAAPGAFQIAPGGYMIVRENPGIEQLVFGKIKMVEWLHTMKKHPAGRTSRRLAKTNQKSWWKYLL